MCTRTLVTTNRTDRPALTGCLNVLCLRVHLIDMLMYFRVSLAVSVVTVTCFLLRTDRNRVHLCLCRFIRPWVGIWMLISEILRALDVL